MEISLLNDYIVVTIVGICLCVGYIIKTSLDFIPNKYIPLVLSIIGLVLNYINAGISIQSTLGGLFSSLVSTGLYESFRNFINKETL